MLLESPHLSTYNMNNAFNLLTPLIVGLHLFNKLDIHTFCTFYIIILLLQHLSTLRGDEEMDDHHRQQHHYHNNDDYGQRVMM